METLRFGVETEERIEDGEDVAAVFEDALEDGTLLWFLGGFLVPFGEDCGRNSDVGAELLRRMAAQEQAVEERGFALREIEIVLRLFGHSRQGCRIGLSRHNEKNAVYRFRAPRQEYVKRKKQKANFSSASGWPGETSAGR